MPPTPEQIAKLKELAQRADEHGLPEGLFHNEPGKGMTLEEAALWAWEAGYIPAPSITALLERLSQMVDLSVREAEEERAKGIKEREELHEKLKKLMPLNSMIIELWNWDVHFEEDLEFDWFFEAALGSDSSLAPRAHELAEYFLQAIDENGIDFDQDSDPEGFKELIEDEAKDFIRAWRKKIAKAYAQQAVPGDGPRAARSDRA